MSSVPDRKVKILIAILIVVVLCITNSEYLLTDAYAQVIPTYTIFLPLVMKPSTNTSPTNMLLSNTSVAENKPAYTQVGTLTTIDSDPSNTFTYLLVSGAGDVDNSSFNISGSILYTSVIFDYETKNSYNIRIRTTDQGGLSMEKNFSISVTDEYDTLPAGVTILPNHSWYVDSIDYLNIVGEVSNNTNSNLRFVKIAVNVFNSSGNLLATDYTYTWLNDLPAKEKTCFELFIPKPVGWSYYEFEPVEYWTDGTPLPNLTAFNHSGSYDSTFGWYEIIGMVRNDTSTNYEYVQPVGTLYNGSGSVIGCDFTFTNLDVLNPGQSSAFEMTFYGRDYSDVASYRLQVDGSIP